ncbi:zinc ribbon domain-containing protein [Pelosinus baikalensis]
MGAEAFQKAQRGIGLYFCLWAMPLSGLLYCAKCGRTMQYKRYKGKNETYWSTARSATKRGEN